MVNATIFDDVFFRAGKPIKVKAKRRVAQVATQCGVDKVNKHEAEVLLMQLNLLRVIH